MIYIVPAVLLITFIAAAIKRVKIYDSFIVGIRESLTLVINLLPYLASIFMLIEIFRASGLSQKLTNILALPFYYLGIPKELIELLILRPLSGTGSLALVETIFTDYGVDSYVARCASVIMASNDTIFYVTAVYFSASADKRSGSAVIISVAASFLGAILACILCRFM
ncbi:MAG TPA: spore maturation protein [Clostridia bacterium]|jgi:spore maturation protein B|nr:spore maturation protein [Clostridia bacterium]